MELIKKNQLSFPINLLPEDEIEAFIADSLPGARHHMTKAEKEQFYKAIPKKTNKTLKQLKTKLGFELSQERNTDPLH